MPAAAQSQWTVENWISVIADKVTPPTEPTSASSLSSTYSLQIKILFNSRSSFDILNQFQHHLLKLIRTNKSMLTSRFGSTFNSYQGGITCGAIDEPRKSSKLIDERVIINFCDKLL